MENIPSFVSRANDLTLSESILSQKFGLKTAILNFDFDSPASIERRKLFRLLIQIHRTKHVNPCRQGIGEHGQILCLQKHDNKDIPSHQISLGINYTSVRFFK
jgi:hypothetical protein